MSKVFFHRWKPLEVIPALLPNRRVGDTVWVKIHRAGDHRDGSLTINRIDECSFDDVWGDLLGQVQHDEAIGNGRGTLL